jgi:uncharacterized protein YjbJ (UPF0337 family)
MTTSETKDRATGVTKSMRDGAGDAFGAARDAASGAADQVRAGVDGVAERLPDALEAARTGAAATADSLREMPQPTLRLLAALSIGMGLGLYLAGAPRLVTVAAFTPAVLAGLTVVANESGARTKS